MQTVQTTEKKKHVELMNDLDVVHALSENSSGESKLVKPNVQVLLVIAGQPMQSLQFAP